MHVGKPKPFGLSQDNFANRQAMGRSTPQIEKNRIFKITLRTIEVGMVHKVAVRKKQKIPTAWHVMFSGRQGCD